MYKKYKLVFVIFCALAGNLQAQTYDKPVQLLVASWRVRCRDMEELLKQEKVPYQRYDVETDSKGRQLYGTVGAGGVPILIVGNKLIRGYDRFKVLEILDSAKTKKQPLSPKN